jgi:hypothetical protein
MLCLFRSLHRDRIMGKGISINTIKGISCYVCLGACIVPRERERERERERTLQENEEQVMIHNS